MINDEIQDLLDSTKEAIKKQRRVRGSLARKKEEEYQIHLKSRSLFSRFVDITMLSRTIDPETERVVRKALTDCVCTVKADLAIRRDVRRRLSDFKKFVTEKRKAFQGPCRGLARA